MRTTYEVMTEGASAEIEAASLKEAKDAAEAWLCDGWNPEEETTWVHGYLIEVDEEGEEVARHRITATVDRRWTVVSE